jgi:hypothetical protein
MQSTCNCETSVTPPTWKHELQSDNSSITVNRHISVDIQLTSFEFNIINYTKYYKGLI